MTELYLTGVKASAVQKWFKVKPGRDGLTWFQVLGIPEKGFETETVVQHLSTRLQRLKALAAKAKASGRDDYVELAAQLGTDLRAAAELLQDKARCQKYRAVLAESRKQSFQRAVTAAIVPGKKPSAEKMASLLSGAGDFQITEADAKQAINTLVGIEQSENTFRKYGVIKVGEDPTSPNEFDLLCLDESVTDERLIRSQINDQVQKAADFEQKSNRPEVIREAREHKMVFEAAGKLLLSPADRQQRLSEITKIRSQRFAEEVRLLHQPGQTIQADTVINLLSMARQIRLSDSQARQIITQETGFADYMSLLSQRKTPTLGQLGGMKFEVPADASHEKTSRKIYIRNEGAGLLAGRVQPMCDWLTVQPNKISTEGIQEVVVRVDPSELPRGVPTAGQINLETTGGSQTLTVEAVVGAGDSPGSLAERLWGALIYVCGTLCFPLSMIAVFVFQSRSRFLTLQAAQASVVGCFSLGVGLSCLWAMEFCCLLDFLHWPMTIVTWAAYGIGVVCAIMCLAGCAIRIPVVINYAEKFAYQFGDDDLAAT